MGFIPNIFTSLNLLCGFISIVYSIKENFYLASWFIIFAVIFDILDGAVARLIKLTSDFGREFDSLADLISFIAAPVFLFYSLGKANILKLTVLFIFFWSGAFRLARFNLSIRQKEENFFYGLPTTAVGGFWAAYILATLKYKILVSGLVEATIMVALSVLMISRISYPKYQDIELKKSVIFLVVTSIFLAFYLNLAILLVFCLYILISPFLRKIVY